MSDFNTPYTGRGWIGVDLDGTLAHYDGWKHYTHIGEPIMAMVCRVQEWLANGEDVRIFTARADIRRQKHDEYEATINAIERWCVEHIGRALPVTNFKDYQMIELWDDRAVQVVPNLGIAIEEDAYQRGYAAAQEDMG